jgi:hypothetical protein
MDLIYYIGTKVLSFKEKFQGSADSTTYVAPAAKSTVIFAGVTVILIMLLFFSFGVLTSYGSARLSYCYNKYIGADDATAFLFAILCFMFPAFYYPYYGVFLNPVCKMGRMMGGRRH